MEEAIGKAVNALKTGVASTLNKASDKAAEGASKSKRDVLLAEKVALQKEMGKVIYDELEKEVGAVKKSTFRTFTPFWKAVESKTKEVQVLKDDIAKEEKELERLAAAKK